MEKTTLYLPADLQRSLRDLAKRTGRSQADLIREALGTFLMGQSRLRPRSIGIVRDQGGPPAAEAKQWVRRQWERQGSDGRRRADP
ncbi:MAG: ribbon-helix-helix domain-containing protein [Actinomycetota bacterium]|nr:ribbon-helix-helix domain-containing protein [Actinomycetota bacterium]